MDTEYTKGFRAGSVFEMERIIKLLENQQDRYGEDYFHVTNLIELIKGENK